MSDTAILVEGLAKRFGDVVALDGIDFQVPAGTVFGLLGPNGAWRPSFVPMVVAPRSWAVTWSRTPMGSAT